MVGYKRNYSAYRATNRAARKAPTSRYRKYRKRTRMGTVSATRGFAGNYGSSRAEKKVSDIAVGTVQVNTTGAFNLLHIPVLGTDYTARIGRKTLIKSVYIRGRVTHEATNAQQVVASVQPQHVRMILFVDKQPNGAAPAVTDVLNTAEPASQLNLNNRDRFMILKDKNWWLGSYYLNNTNGTSAAMCDRGGYVFKVFKKCGIETIFNGTNGGTIADINSGALFMFWIGSTAAGANSDANAQLSTRVRFIDN